jgi:signal transduction histidine kinase
LNLVADLKKERLLRWMEERRNDARVVARNPLVQDNMPALSAAVAPWRQAGRDDQQFRAMLQDEASFKVIWRLLEEIRRTYGVYTQVQLADVATGIVVVSTNLAALGENIRDKPRFQMALRSRESCVDQVDLAPGSSQPVFHISHIVGAADPKTGEPREDEPIAVLVLEVNADDIIKPMLHTGEGLGKQGEALLVNQQRIILTSLKHPLADGSRARPLEHQISAKPALFAARGEEGIIDEVDYRGEPVLAAYRHIRISPERGWGLVVKLDKAELFAPVRQALACSLLLGVAGASAFVVLSVVLARSLTRPIRSLAHTAGQVAAGDLSARGSIFASDEVGLLAVTFNHMLNRVQNWHQELEAEVNVRTDQLSTANEGLKSEISERRRAEKEREKLVAQLEAKNVELEQFTYTVSHDLKSPLITIEGFLGLAKEAVARGDLEAFHTHTATITRAVRKMDRLLSELLHLSMSGQATNPLEELDLGEIVGAAVESVAGKIHQSRTRVEVASNLPRVCGDRLRLQEVFQNLIENGVKYIGDQPEPRIEIGVEPDGDEPIIFVRDNGMGIEPQYRERVFGLFEQLDSRMEGTGVGLALVKRIVEVHGGRIWVESAGPGKGSTFCLTLPARADSRV